MSHGQMETDREVQEEILRFIEEGMGA